MRGCRRIRDESEHLSHQTGIAAADAGGAPRLREILAGKSGGDDIRARKGFQLADVPLDRDAGKRSRSTATALGSISQSSEVSKPAS